MTTLELIEILASWPSKAEWDFEEEPTVAFVDDCGCDFAVVFIDGVPTKREARCDVCRVPSRLTASCIRCLHTCNPERREPTGEEEEECWWL